MVGAEGYFLLMQGFCCKSKQSEKSNQRKHQGHALRAFRGERRFFGLISGDVSAVGLKKPLGPAADSIATAGSAD